MILIVSLLALLGLSVGLMLGVLALVRRHPWAKGFRETNDIAGFYITLFGTLYGVFLGFMSLAVWTRFDQAETLTQQEATALVSVYALASDLPAEIRDPVRRDIAAYCESVVRDEWPAMDAGKFHAEPTFRLMNTLWRNVSRIRPARMGEQVIMEQVFTQMSNMYQARRLRLLSNMNRLPWVFWMVLIVGAIITVGSTTLFGVDRFAFHAIKTSLLTILIFLILFAIWEIDMPFRDFVHVSSDPFERNLALFQEIQADERSESEMQKTNNLYRKKLFK